MVRAVQRAGGLPPLVRGARAASQRTARSHGPTPAGAGSTALHLQAHQHLSAYPRWCGEHTGLGFHTEICQGLPPLVRGAHSTPCASAAKWLAYPRWCGEHKVAKLGVSPVEGLPPLVRGAPCAVLGQLTYRRPTPAGAGSTPAQRRTPTQSAAYPRWCGEHDVGDAEIERVRGLPPLVRGARMENTDGYPDQRPTPAGAGSTIARCLKSLIRSAYPRWCGEHGYTKAQNLGKQGLPPLVRGAPSVTCWFRRAIRPCWAHSSCQGALRA